jgi:hypothetical protein
MSTTNIPILAFMVFLISSSLIWQPLLDKLLYGDEPLEYKNPYFWPHAIGFAVANFLVLMPSFLVFMFGTQDYVRRMNLAETLITCFDIRLQHKDPVTIRMPLIDMLDPQTC